MSAQRSANATYPPLVEVLFAVAHRGSWSGGPVMWSATISGYRIATLVWCGAYAALFGVGLVTMPVGIAIGSPLWGLAKDLTRNYASSILIAIAIATASTGADERIALDHPGHDSKNDRHSSTPAVPGLSFSATRGGRTKAEIAGRSWPIASVLSSFLGHHALDGQLAPSSASPNEI